CTNRWVPCSWKPLKRIKHLTTDKSQMVTIKISSSIPKFLLLGIVLGIITVFGIEHFGKFSYLEEARYMPVQNGKPSFTREISMNTTISQIYFKTPFGSNLTFGGNGY